MIGCGMTQERRGPPGSFSASQISSFDLCKRKWGWNKLDGIPGPPNEYASFGLRLHAQLERYLRDGVPFDLTHPEGEAAMAGIHYLPATGSPGMVIEGNFTFQVWGHTFIGFKDIEERDGLVPRITDHKSTGNLKWAKTPAELAEDFQGVLYAADTMVSTGSDAVDLQWIYYKRSRPFKAMKVEVQVTRESIGPTLERIKGLADEMSLIRLSGAKARDLPPNPRACSAFGGCPYVRHCDLSPNEELSAIMSQAGLDAGKNAFLETIKAQQQRMGGAGVAVNPPTGASPQGLPPGYGAPPQGPPPGYPPSGVPGGFTATPQNGAPPAQAWAPPPGQNTAPLQGPPPGSPPGPVVDEQILIQARALHANWAPGTPWWNGAAYVNPSDPAYPPIYVAATAPTPQNGEQAPAGSRRGRRAKNPDGSTEQDPESLAAEAFESISSGFRKLAQAVKNGLWGE